MPKKISKKELQDDLASYQLIDVVAQSEGGRLIIDKIKKDIILSMDIIASDYLILDHAKLIARCAEMQGKMNLLKLFVRSKKNSDWLMEELERYEDE